jgi:hypothetical protein
VHIACHVLLIDVEASITLLSRDDATAVASTDKIAVVLDERQYGDERGPCLDAASAGRRPDAMANRAVIEQAKGIVMRDRGCSVDEAFDALALLSQQTQTKLRDVAQQLVDQVSSGQRDPMP